MIDGEIENAISREIHRTTPNILDGLMDELGLDADAVSAGDRAALGVGEPAQASSAPEWAADGEPAQTGGGPTWTAGGEPAQASSAPMWVADGEPTQASSGFAQGTSNEPAQASSGFAQGTSNEPVQGERTETERKLRRPNGWRLAALPVAAVLAFVAIGIFAWPGLHQDVFAVVGLDVNPSIELSIDANERVLSAQAINDDASAVLDDLDLQGTDLDTACYAVIGSMLVKGYLKASSNSILVSISSPDGEGGKALEQRVSEGLSTYLRDSDVDVSILGQYVDGDEELKRFASENGISLGKAWLIKKLLDLGTLQADEASLLKLPTQELILLAQERNVEAETSIGASDTSEYITRDKAISVALEDAGLQGQDAINTQVEFDCEDSILVYEVEFYGEGKKWEYEINARTGKIVSVETQPVYIADPTAGDDDDDDGEWDDDADDADDDDEWDDADDDSDDWDDHAESIGDDHDGDDDRDDADGDDHDDRDDDDRDDDGDDD